MEQRMITGNGGSGRSKEAESHRNESLVDSITSYATIGALGGTVSTPRSANTAMQHAPFKLNGNSSPSMLSSLQGSIFDTPPSLNNSPMYHSLFSSPLGGFTSPSRVVVSCSLCNGDCARDMNAIHFNTCKHIYCGGCATLGAGDGKICAMCTLSTIHKQPPFSLQHFTDRQKQGDLDTALPSGMGEGVGLSHLWDSSSSRHCSPQSFLTTSMTPLSIAPVERSSNFASSLICAACQEGQLATHYCKQCREPLCTDCVGAHQRVRITRGHHIIVLETSHSQNAQCTQQDLLSETSLSLPTFPGIEICSPEHVFMPTSALGGSTCRLHTGMPLKFRCDTTSCSLNGPICLRCLAEHQNHQISIIGDAKSVFRMIVGDLRQDEKFIDEAISSVQHMCERVDASVRSTANELRSEIHKHVSALEERKRELLQRVETVRNVKQATLKRQADELVQRRAHLSQVLRSVDQHYENSGASFSSELLNLVSKVVSYRLGFLDPFEIDLIRFTVPDSQLITKNRTLGDLESGPSAQKTTIISERFNRAILDRQCTIQVQLRDACGETICVSGYAQFLTASLTDPIGASVELNICERDVGVVSISFQPIQEGKHVLNIMIHGLAISGCPVSIDARRGRNYQDICDRGELFHFGTEGSEDGELCRPWGICCDHKGRVIVADRSNNRIQIFDGDGRFLMKFGSGGSRAGQFDRPAGICTNSLNHIVVADKDNHRIQVFDELGNFVLKFGERGRPVGMFNYPWGVATNSQNNIAVSDTRNHRVQIFTCNGQFIRKCGFDTAYFYKHLDSPRGVCYLPDGQLLITDFNNHRVVMMNQRSGTDMKCYGSEGDQEGMFLRPQGIKTDLEGHILVCDSRNNRIQVFSADDMCCVATFGGAKLALAPPPGLQLTTPTVSASTNMVLPPSSPTSPPSLLSLTTQLTGIGTPLFTDFSSPPPNAFSLPADGDVSVDQRVEDTPVGSGSNDHEISEPALLDRPTDLCVGPDGRIYVVDFGHNCIRVF